MPFEQDKLVITALAAAGQSATFSPVQVQKLFFLIDREAAALVDGPHFDFAPYDYGPFDSAVYSVLAQLEREGYVQSTHSGRYRFYSLTQQGYTDGSMLLSQMAPAIRNYLVQVADWVRHQSFAQLVSAIYKKYPEMKMNSVFRG